MISPLEVLAAEASGSDIPVDDEAMLRWQFSQIRSALNRAVAGGGAYAKRFAGVDISAVDSFEALRRIPFTYPDEITADPTAFVCEPQRDISRVTSLRTSGSTGPFKRIYFTGGDLDRTRRLFELGMAPIIGKGKRCLIMMSDASFGSIASLLKEGVERSGIPAVIYGGIKDFDAAAAAVREGDSIVGIPAQLIHLSRKYPELRPESVLLSADYVPAPAARSIKDLWGCRVYTHYGMTETCFGCAVQCSESSAQHIRHDALLIEIIDPQTGRQLAFGEEGEIVVTAFANEAMPLFRYRTGDVSSLVAGKCECGSVLPRLGAVKGRLRNIISLPGASFSIESLDDVLYQVPDLWEYGVELQENAGAEELRVNVCGSGELDLFKLHKLLAATLPPALAFKITRSGTISQPFRKRRISVK